MYDTNMETINYSSSGPTYELVDTNEGAGQTYSAQDQISCVVAKTTTENKEQHYHILESGGCDCKACIS